ncbi:MAG: molybdopterin molybdotransferase MoeA [Campylobacterales bacterium]|nr:molybdopterin molybdotransferase MoeA [Campylobacterales bacterium]
MAFIDFETSLQIVNDLNPKKTATLELPLMQTLGFVLAQDIKASENSPPKPTAAMDGYAVRHEDMVLEKLIIEGINPAGSDIVQSVEKGKCIKTFTGSLMPRGSDTLIPIENVEVQGESIIIASPVPKGFSVRGIGENYEKDELLIPAGTKIDFAQIGVMASLNIDKLRVYSKPKVAIFATGSELLDLGETQTSDAQIRSSNHYTIEAIVTKYGGSPLQLGCVKDDKTIITHAMQKALRNSDIVVTTGGVSVGDFDFVKDVIKEIGFEVLFQGVHIKPGQHIMLARKEDQFILGLPGFAYSSTVTALLYLLPLIARFTDTYQGLRTIKATLQESYTKKTNKTEFVACRIKSEHDRYLCDFGDKKLGSSAILTNMLGPTALIKLSSTDTSKQVGDEVSILFID